MEKRQYHSCRGYLLPAIAIFAVGFIYSSSAVITTASADVGFPIVQNTIDVVDISFQTTTNAITLKWMVDTAGAAGALLDVGIVCSPEGYPLVIKNLPDTIKFNTKPEDSLNLQLGDRLLFDTTYYITLLLRRRGGLWLAATDSSRGIMKTPQFVWQAVKYGVGFPTAYANNGTIRISVDPTKFSTGVDYNRIVRWGLPASNEGLLPVSMGFEFFSKYLSVPISVGVKYGPIPSNRSLADIRIYRYKNSAWFLDRSPFVCDSSQGYVAVVTGDIYSPFVAMIDTQPPAVNVLSHPDTAVLNGKAVADTFLITDNISNAGWEFHYAKGGDSFEGAPGDSGMLGSSFGNIVTVMQGSVVSADQGVRAFLSVNDGVNTIVRNVSRRVVRNIGGSDVVLLDSMKWVPLSVTAQLDSPEVRSALQIFSKNGQWKYDNTRFRLFRWIADAGTGGNGEAHYVEYADTCESLFSFVPGRLMWIKTRKSVVVDFGKGITPDLTKPSEVTLKAHSWTDFSLPFNFNIKVGDILNATQSAGQTTDGLRFCTWLRDSTRHYLCRELYAPQLGIEELQDLSKIMTAKQGDGTGAGYSVYNQSDADINLSIPPLPAAMSKYTAFTGKKKARDGGWTIKIASRTSSGIFLNDVYCVCTHDNRTSGYLPAAPSLGGGVDIRVCDEAMRQYGHIIATTQGNTGEGVKCNLAFSNNSNKAETIRVSVSGPSNLRAALFYPGSEKNSGAPFGAAEGWDIDAAAGSIVYCQFFAGDDAFIGKAGLQKKSSKAELLGMYANPTKHSIRIQFSLPAGPMRRVTFAIFDMMGRKLWNASRLCQEGINKIEWYGTSMEKLPASSGAYILQMTVSNAEGKKAAVFDKKLTWLP